VELFTLGVGNYTEGDGREAARALTGWRVDVRTGAARLDPDDHDAGPKSVLGTTADYDAPGLTDLLVTQPASVNVQAAVVDGKPGHVRHRLTRTSPAVGGIKG
jgi:uncharacterized protein (DUF1800 family)